MSKALLKYIRLSPTKARLIAREIQGMNAELALATLEFASNKAAAVIYKVLASAIANGNYDAQNVVVKSCRVDAGPVLRRMMPRARGRANVIRKPTSHIFVEVEEAKNIKAKQGKIKDSAKKDSIKKVTEYKAEANKKATTQKAKSSSASTKSTSAKTKKSATKSTRDDNAKSPKVEDK